MPKNSSVNFIRLQICKFSNFQIDGFLYELAMYYEKGTKYPGELPQPDIDNSQSTAAIYSIDVVLNRAVGEQSRWDTTPIPIFKRSNLQHDWLEIYIGQVVGINVKPAWIYVFLRMKSLEFVIRRPTTVVIPLGQRDLRDVRCFT